MEVLFEQEQSRANDVCSLRNCYHHIEFLTSSVTYSSELCAGHHTHKSTLRLCILLFVPHRLRPLDCLPTLMTFPIVGSSSHPQAAPASFPRFGELPSSSLPLRSSVEKSFPGAWLVLVLYPSTPATSPTTTTLSILPRVAP